MKRLLVRVTAACMVLLAVALPAAAQTSPRTEISAGYQFLSFDAGDDNESMPKGWYADVAGNLTPTLGIVFQVGGNYKTFEESISLGGGTFDASADLKVHLFLGGVRLSARGNSAIVPYAQFLVGGASSSIEPLSRTDWRAGIMPEPAQVPDCSLIHATNTCAAATSLASAPFWRGITKL